MVKFVLSYSCIGQVNEEQTRKLAVAPPNMMDEIEGKMQKCNESTLIDGDRMAVLKAETITKPDLWSEQEKKIFTEKYKQYPKKFGSIASFLASNSGEDNPTNCARWHTNACTALRRRI